MAPTPAGRSTVLFLARLLGIARGLWITEGTVEKHIHSILTKLRLPEAEDDHRPALDVVAYLDAR